MRTTESYDEIHAIDIDGTEYHAKGVKFKEGCIKLGEEKLFALENIEDELGIELVTFHKALKNGVYYKVIDKSSANYGKIFFDRYVLWGWNRNSDGTYFAMMQSQWQSFNLKDYGKTWALTEEELL